jgi:drug/metabolite transporter (DMT)-like permease
MPEAQRQHRFAVILAFALVYFFWGSTYLGIDIAVEHIPPALMCGIRFLIAGIFMLAFCGLRGRRILYQPAQLGQMALVGVLLLVGGNLTLSYAEKYVASGLAALIIAVTPLWFLVLDALLLGDHHIALRGKIGLGLGLPGCWCCCGPISPPPAPWDGFSSGLRSACWAGHSAGRWAQCWPRNGSHPKSILSRPPPGR